MAIPVSLARAYGQIGACPNHSFSQGFKTPPCNGKVAYDSSL